MVGGIKLIVGDLFGVDGKVLGFGSNNYPKSRLNFRFSVLG